MRKKWEEFEKKHEKIAKLLIQLLYFWVFSMGVTVLQYLMFTFFPYMFGIEYAGQEFMWPQIPMHVFGIDYKWNILGYEVARNAAGEVIIGGGLGYFISYELGTFLAQCVNFPLQRNITFKSHGNIAWQILWYFIAWILISLVELIGHLMLALLATIPRWSLIIAQLHMQIHYIIQIHYLKIVM